MDAQKFTIQDHVNFSDCDRVLNMPTGYRSYRKSFWSFRIQSGFIWVLKMDPTLMRQQLGGGSTLGISGTLMVGKGLS